MILCASARNLERLKKLRYWVPTSAVFLPTFLTNVSILYRQTLSADLLNKFVMKIQERRMDITDDKTESNIEDNEIKDQMDMDYKNK